MTMTTERVPAPLEWHPAYAEHTYLLDWLNGKEPGRDVVQVIFPKRVNFAEFDATEPIAPLNLNVRTLTKRKCMGGAPYVGRPFRYVWFVATDELGRAIAADSERWYDPMDDYTQPWSDPYDVPDAGWLS